MIAESTAIMQGKMSQLSPLPWFQRTFAFNRKLEEAPNIISRLSGAPARLKDITSGVEERVLRRRPIGADGKLVWGVFDHAGHLADIDDLHARRFREFVEGVEQLSPADPENKITTAAHYNRLPLAPIIERFRIERTTTTNYLSALPIDAFASTATHPRLKKSIRLIDYMEFVAEHDDHHLATIRDLIWNPARYQIPVPV